MKTLERLGIDNSFDFLYNKLHVKSLIDSYETPSGNVVTDKALAPLALGQLSFGLTVQEITNAYSIFVNEGKISTSRLWTKVTDNFGNIILENPITQDQAISPQSATIMTKMLQEVVSSGTASSITLQNYVNCAGKTGTTQEDYDRWFVGYTPYYVAGIWFGYDLNQSLSEYWTNPAVVLWDRIMTELHQKYIDEANNGGQAIKTFVDAPGVITATYCKDSGQLLSGACYADPRGSRADSGYFTEATKPKSECDVHVLVDYCTKGNGVACSGCPKKDVKSVGLLNVDRYFDYQVYVNDAQYTCKQTAASHAAATNLPYYQYALGGKYSGISNADRQYNCSCTIHSEKDKDAEKNTTEAATTTAPPETTKPKETETAKPETSEKKDTEEVIDTETTPDIESDTEAPEPDTDTDTEEATPED